MSKKHIKLIPIDFKHFTTGRRNSGKSAIDIIAPYSYESSERNVNDSLVGFLGNSIETGKYFNQREYSINWRGTKAEINKIRLYVSQLNSDAILFAGLSDQTIKTPTMLFNAKGNLAALVEQYKPFYEEYQNYLPFDQLKSDFPRSTVGVRLGGSHLSVANQFEVLPGEVRGAVAYHFIPAGVESVLSILRHTPTTTAISKTHGVSFYLTYMSLDKNTTRNAGTTSIDPNSYTTLNNWVIVNSVNYDRVVAIQPFVPGNTSNYTISSLRGVLNYIPPILADYRDWDLINNNTKLKTQMDASIDDIPSALVPTDGGTYNLIKASGEGVAEFSCNFREVASVL